MTTDEMTNEMTNNMTTELTNDMTVARSADPIGWLRPVS